MRSVFSYFVKDESCPLGMGIKRVEVEGCAMPDTYLNGRPVYFGDTHLDGVDSFFESAYYCDTDVDLDESELYELDEQCADYLVERCCEEIGYFKK